MNKPRVLVVEDDEFTRALLVSALQSQNYDVVLNTSSASYAVQTSRKMNIDVAILDLDLGSGPTGLDVALGLRRKKENIGIVFLTTFKDPRLLKGENTMAPYGSIFLEKRNLTDISKLGRSVEKAIINSQTSHTHANIEFKGFQKGTSFTSSQIDTMRLVSEGQSNLEIAQIRGVTEKSIEQTLSRILKNTDIKLNDRKNRRVELALYFLRETGALKSENE